MAIRVIQLGSPRMPAEGLRIGTVRRPPRGVPKAEFASRNYYDVWLPQLAPSAAVMAQGKEAQTPQQWDSFMRAYGKQMSEPDTCRLLDLLAAMSHSSDFSVGCYCEQEVRCHRSVLRQLFQQRGALLRDST